MIRKFAWPVAVVAGLVACAPGAGRSPTDRPASLSRFNDCAANCPEMVALPGGTFLLGSPSDEPERDDAEGPQQRMAVRPFAIGRFDVTRAQWASFVAATKRPVVGGCSWAGPIGHRPDPAASWQHVDFEQTDEHPVVCVTWFDAQAYAAWLSQRTGRRYRLPTEAEWEYAARAGTRSPFSWGTIATHEQANYGKDECCSGLADGRDRWVGTSPVGAFAPNAFGLHDMNGNVMQWVQDCLWTYGDAPPAGSTDAPGNGSTAHERAEPLQPGTFLLPGMAGSSSCDYRMLRGGDWGDPPYMLRSAFRNYGPPRGSTLYDYKSGGAGFRVARDLD